MRFTQKFKVLIGGGLFIILGTVALAQQKTIDFSKVDKVLGKNDLVFATKAINPVALKAMQRGLKPGSFKGVKYEYRSNVAVLKPAARGRLRRSLSPDGIVRKEALGPGTLHSDSIYIDPSSDLVLQAAPLSQDSLMVFKPKFREVFKDIYIPEQTVPLNLANTDYVIDGAVVYDRRTAQQYDMVMRFDSVSYHVEKESKTENSKTKVTFDVTLKGMIGFSNPVIEGKYTANDGYKLVFKAGEHVELKIISDAKLTHRTSIPLWGFDIPADDLGKCKVGVFLAIDVDGEARLVVEVDQGIDVEAGIRGGTLGYFPRSVHTINNTTHYCNIGYEVTGKIKAFGGVDVIAEMKIKGYDILKVRARGGVEANVEKTADKMFLDADVGFRVLLDGEVKELDKKFTLYDKYFLLWESKERDFGGYELIVREADAYYDRVHGIIYKKQDSSPYHGDLTLFVKHPNGSETRYDGSTDENGIFAMTGIDLKKGDMVSVKIAASPNRSRPVAATIPFKEISLTYADYYTNIVAGNVSSRVNTFPVHNAPQPQPQATKAASTVPPIGNTPKISKMVVAPAAKFDLAAFRNALTYKGPVEIIVEPIARTLDKNPGRVSPAPKSNRKAAAPSNKPAGLKIAKKSMPAGVKNMLSPAAFTTTVNRPFGFFVVKNAKITPGDKVKARINIDGFILESPWVAADGLAFSPIFDEERKGSIFDRTISARNSYAIVTALRSDTPPPGKVRMIKGIDMKHSKATLQAAMQQGNPVSDIFREARHPLVFFDKEVTLQPAGGTGGAASVAATGPWEISNIYYDMRNKVSLWDVDGHRFEYVGYTYEGKWTGYKFYQQKCGACDGMNGHKLQQISTSGAGYGLSGDIGQRQISPTPVIIMPSVKPGAAPINNINKGKFNMQKHF